MAKGKVISTKTPSFIKGGGKPMFGKQSAVKQKPGTTATGGAKSKWPGKLGGGGKMFGKQTAKPSKAR